MHYSVPGLSPQTFGGIEPVEPFLKEIGMTVENLPKLTIKREDILDNQGSKVIVLEKR